MAPRIKVTRENIADSAFALVRREGIDALTAKSLAKELGCSTQPIFWWYENMDEVKAVVSAKARELFGSYLHEDIGGVNRYKAIGLNYIRFATEEKNLFRLLYMSERSDKANMFDSEDNRPFILQVIRQNNDVPADCAEKVFTEMWLFSHGIATMAVSGTAEFRAEDIDAMLSDVYRGLVERFNK